MPEIREQKIEPKAKVEPYEIHVMPAKFHKYLAIKKGGLGRFFLILVIILIATSGATLGAYYYLYLMPKQPAALPGPAANFNQPPLNLNENINLINEAPANLNENVNVNLNENLNLNANENVNANLNLNENLNANLNLNANENLNANINVPVTMPALNYTSSPDADNDGLTDEEENIYNTERRKPDTDEDGYLDGLEVAGGYNPKAASGALLDVSGLVNKYTNTIFNYEVLYPAAWLAKPTDQSLSEVIFQSATGEYMEILVEDNLQNLDLVNWYVGQSPNVDLNQLKRETTAKGYDLLISADKLNYYLMDQNNPGKIYVISYNIGNKSRVNFLTTFAMIKNSFNLIEQSPAATLETNTNTNP